MNLEDRKGISSIEQELRQKIRELQWDIDKLNSDLRYKDRLIGELKAIKNVK